MDRKYLSDLLYECLPLNFSNPSISSKLSKHSKHSNSSNKLNTSKVSDCPGSYMSWWVTKIEFKELERGKGVID